MVFEKCISKFYCRSKKFHVSNILKSFLSDKKLVSYNDPRNSLEATFTQVPNCDPIKPVLFLERKFACVHRGPVRFRTDFGSVHTDTQSYRSLTFPIKTQQKNSHLLTKFNNRHRRTRGKFILLNLKSIGNIVESLHLKSIE